MYVSADYRGEVGSKFRWYILGFNPSELRKDAEHEAVGNESIFLFIKNELILEHCHAPFKSKRLKHS